MNRRELLRASAAVALLSGASSELLAQPTDSTATDNAAPRGLRILILGGTGFIGPHQVGALLARGHTLTLFNRGKQAPSKIKNVETLIGDRNGDVAALKGRDWDAVIDNSGFTPKQAQLTADVLQGHTQRYIFISSVSAYANAKTVGIDESYPLAQINAPTAEEATGDTYGAFKALCEQVINKTFGEQATILRPTYIVGPGDTADFFTYWPTRVARGGEMLAPGSQDDLLQLIDVRDLATFVRTCIENNVGGHFNVCSPPGAITFGDLLSTSRRLAKSKVRFTWADRDFLSRNAHLERGEIPLWTPATGDYVGASLISSARAVSHGLRFRPLENTVRDLLVWHRKRPPAERTSLKAGLTPEREIELLRLLHAGSA